MENPNFGKRMSNCFTVHWNGWLYFMTPLVLLPLVFLEPHIECRTILILLWGFIWYVSDSIQPGIISMLPIIFAPPFGLMASQEVCMSYFRDSEMVFMLSIFMAATMEYTGFYKQMAYSFLKHISCNPKIILIVLMVQSYVLSIFITDAMVCSLMMPLTRGLLQILENTSVAKTIDESKEPKDDENPYSTKVVKAFYIGIAYAVNIGSMTTAHSSEVGAALHELMEQNFQKSSFESGLYVKYLSISLPISLLLLIFTIFYLEFTFLGLTRQEIVFDNEASKSALQSVKDDLPPYNAHMLMTIIFLVITFVIVSVTAFTGVSVEGKLIKYSFNAMMLCFLYFVVPRNCDFCNYFICRKPNVYKRIPNILPWNEASKATPWNYLLVYGCSLAHGALIKHTGLYRYFGGYFIKSGGTLIKQIGLMTITLLLTVVTANHLLAESMLELGAQVALTAKIGPLLILFPIMWTSCMSFFLPISSVANCFASGWGNLRAQDLMLAGIAPTVFGFLFALCGCILASSLSFLTELAY